MGRRRIRLACNGQHSRINNLNVTPGSLERQAPRRQTVEGTLASEDLMFKTVLCSTLALVAGSAVVVMADAKDDVTAAATKLSDASNYSWKSASESAGGGGGGGGGRGGGPVEGKTEKGGFTVLSMARGDNTFQVIIKGDKVVMQNRDGDWQTGEEMAAAAAAAQQNQDPNAQPGGRRRGRGSPAAMYQNYKLPAELATDLASKATKLDSNEGAITGELSEDGAKALMTFGRGGGGRRGGGAGGNAAGGGGNGPQISNAKATVKFWLKDGVLAKYETHITGTMSRGGNDVDIDRTTTVEIADVGSTKVEVPDGAKKKFE
jgi:hypothetical protein